VKVFLTEFVLSTMNAIVPPTATQIIRARAIIELMPFFLAWRPLPL